MIVKCENVIDNKKSLVVLRNKKEIVLRRVYYIGIRFFININGRRK